ncbi:MAG: tRNA (adenosine(37)-N6)-dimethylallyltransferase MiaA, partial [bacterium]|nr:tRNA (adenosine(37)-N6)-dimethylallyltransferase MiaA [bacterium]
VPQSQFDNSLIIGLTAPKGYLHAKISKRVNQMIKEGLEEEVNKLVRKYGWSSPGLKTMGYIEWKEYFEGQITIDQVKDLIVTSHTQYARKQMIYFKKFQRITWFDVSLSSNQEILDTIMK